jgi:hypothetical protein
MPANGGPCPYPIPWLDKNGSHNQMPKIGFEFKTDALETSKADFAVMGEEVNGKYYG